MINRLFYFQCFELSLYKSRQNQLAQMYCSYFRSVFLNSAVDIPDGTAIRLGGIEYPPVKRGSEKLPQKFQKSGLSKRVFCIF